jgi:phenylacetate-CoA ligase
VRQLVQHAYDKVPYYRRLLDDNGIRPASIRHVEDLQKIPVTRKSDLKDLPLADRIAAGVDIQSLISHTTGGSTGEPFTIHRSWLEERIAGLIRRRALQDYGARRGSLIVVATYHYKPGKNDRAWLEAILSPFVGARVKGVFALDPPAGILAGFARVRPDIIGGYAGVLDRLAEHIENNGRSFDPPLCVLSGAEVLTDDVRDRVRKAFSAPVYDTYGAHEFSRIAWQCPQSGEYHRADDSVVTEIMTDGRFAKWGEPGTLIGTALHSYAMPFIRYELGDTITAGSERCPCGAPFSTLLRIEGREVDYFVTSGGSLIHPFILADAMKPAAIRWVGRYQIVQETVHEVKMTAVARDQPTQEEMRGVLSAARSVLGDDVSFSIDLVKDLKLDPNGKHRIYRSKVRRG